MHLVLAESLPFSGANPIVKKKKKRKVRTLGCGIDCSKRQGSHSMVLQSFILVGAPVVPALLHWR